MRRNPIRRLELPQFISASVAGLFTLLACSVSAQNPLPTPGIPTEAEAERVIVTGSNIPTAEEVGPNPVDTYSPASHRKLGVRNATDLLTKLPQEMGRPLTRTPMALLAGRQPYTQSAVCCPKTLVSSIEAPAIIGSGGGLRRCIAGVAAAQSDQHNERTPAEVERVIVTGSNIPTAEETGPNPVDTYRPADIEKLGIRNATDLTTFLPQQSGATTNLNIGMAATALSNSTCAACWPKKLWCWLTENVLPLVR